MWGSPDAVVGGPVLAGCANLFQPFYSVCADPLWPVCCLPDGSPFPTAEGQMVLQLRLQLP